MNHYPLDNGDHGLQFAPGSYVERAGRGGYARVPAGLDAPRDPRAAVAVDGLVVPAHGTRSAYGAGLVGLPGNFDLVRL